MARSAVGPWVYLADASTRAQQPSSPARYPPSQPSIKHLNHPRIHSTTTTTTTTALSPRQESSHTDTTLRRLAPRVCRPSAPPTHGSVDASVLHTADSYILASNRLSCGGHLAATKEAPLSRPSFHGCPLLQDSSCTSPSSKTLAVLTTYMVTKQATVPRIKKVVSRETLLTSHYYKILLYPSARLGTLWTMKAGDEFGQGVLLIPVLCRYCKWLVSAGSFSRGAFRLSYRDRFSHRAKSVPSAFFITLALIKPIRMRSPVCPPLVTTTALRQMP